MQYMIEGNKEHCKGVTLHKVDDYHYILTVSTKDKYYEDYTIMSGSDFIDKKLSSMVSIRFENYNEEDDYYKEIFKVILYDNCLNDFVIHSVTPLKHEYQVYIVNYENAFVTSDMKEIDLKEI
jgi:hypothetical protein